MDYFALFFIPLLLYIFYTDIRLYKVNVFALVLLLGLSLFCFYSNLGYKQGITVLFINILFFIILLSIVYLVAIIREKKLLNVIGGGDILFFSIAASNFTPLNLNLFLLVSALLAICIILYRFGAKKEESRIPFAGVMSIVLIGFILIDIFTYFNAYNDQLLIQFLMP